MLAQTQPGSATTDLAHVVLRVAESARSVARTRRVLLSVEIESADAVVSGAERAVEDAVLDVVGRAVSTCGAGALVVLDLHRADGGVALDVVDTGVGPADRTDPQSARALLETLGGHVDVATVDGVGTSVRMWWPLSGGAAGTGTARPLLAVL